jgi:diaminopimelate epimerase
MTLASTVRLTKHHALGNDFLVWVDGVVERGPESARRWCDRRRGIGADGLLVATRGALADAMEWSMALFNADGSRAEMSGNGIRCFVQAVGDGRPGRYTVHTDAGVRVVEAVASEQSGTIEASVTMGRVEPGHPSAHWPDVGCHPDRPVVHVDLGNPHTVVGVEDLDAVDLEAIGAKVPDVNLEIVQPGPELYAITMRVHERGAGTTEACGTGACASAWAAVQWGLVPSSAREVTVHMVGGDAIVRLDQPERGHVTLVGPATFVGAVEVPA